MYWNGNLHFAPFALPPVVAFATAGSWKMPAHVSVPTGDGGGGGGATPAASSNPVSQTLHSSAPLLKQSAPRFGEPFAHVHEAVGDAVGDAVGVAVGVAVGDANSQPSEARPFEFLNPDEQVTLVQVGVLTAPWLHAAVQVAGSSWKPLMYISAPSAPPPVLSYEAA